MSFLAKSYSKRSH
jgi:hypothetical protein